MKDILSAYSRTLDLLFLQIQPEQLLERLFDTAPSAPAFTLDLLGTLRQLYFRTAERSFSGHSGNEQQLFWQWLDEKTHAASSGLPPWQIIADYGSKVLLLEQGEPRCRYEQVLSWRETYLRLGQDLIVTAWLAEQNVRGYGSVTQFAWPATISTNSRRLSALLRREGLAENHYHLYGSAQVFPLSWCCLMNHPGCASKLPWLDEQLFAKSSRGTMENLWDPRRRLCYAAQIRALLFQLAEGGITEQEVVSRLQSFHRLYDSSSRSRVSAEVMRLRALYGLRFPQPHTTQGDCLDYAFSTALSSELDADERLAAAERRLLYLCFSACFSGRMTAEVQWIFYIYLLLKTSFRAELIQMNRQVGFMNFSRYERRKYTPWQERIAYWNEAYRTALNEPLNGGCVRSIEARLSPSPKVGQMLRNLHQADLAKLFFDDPQRAFGWQASRSMENRSAEEKTFYVWHFTKRRDELLCREGYSLLYCRDFNLRRSVKWASTALVDALYSCEYFRQRARGIDACSNEIGCRPEVFANVYRFLRGTVLSRRPDPFHGKLPVLSFTYHAGEDFLEIADGLRAIDEAVLFLGLRRGDRLGHALALGVDPAEHYQIKSSIPILTKQDCLDNLIWLLFRSTELSVSMPGNLRADLEARADDLLQAIYGSVLQNSRVSLREYYLSWLLRGDSPERYRSGRAAVSWFSDEYDFYALNAPADGRSLAAIRLDPRISALYFSYHFSTEVKRRGAETISFAVTEEYLDFLRLMQDAMQRFLIGKGISIECTPSSNALIGTFRAYEKHPVFRFCRVEQEESSLHVSINTDDQGVFDTSLPFEYALIASALSQQKKLGTDRCFSDQEIEQYLQRLIRMGWEQVFPAAL